MVIIESCQRVKWLFTKENDDNEMIHIQCH